MSDVLEVATPIIGDESMDDLTADQLRDILYNHAECIAHLIAVNNNLNDSVGQLTQVVTAYTMQYPLDIAKLTAGDGTPITPSIEAPAQGSGGYL